jgi:hypothetical protein
MCVPNENCKFNLFALLVDFLKIIFRAILVDARPQFYSFMSVYFVRHTYAVVTRLMN